MTDRLGLTEEKPNDRYLQRREGNCDTVVIMECKIWICRILGLICTARLDIRLSRLLNRYRSEREMGVWPDDDAAEPGVDGAGRAASIFRLGNLGTRLRQTTISSGARGDVEMPGIAT